MATIRIRISRRFAVAVACGVAALAAPTGAMALTTHSTTTSTVNANGFLTATATCAANQRVVSGGYTTSQTDPSGAAVISRAVKGNAWKVRYFTFQTPETLTAYAYCARKGQFSISTHGKKVTAQPAQANTVATARCASGQTLLSGGYALIAAEPKEQNSPTYRDYAASARNWGVMSVLRTAPGQLAAFAYCSSGATFVKVRSASASIAASATGSATASCHSRETLLAGGYTTKPTPDLFNITRPDFFYSGSHRSGRRSWTASAYNASSVGGTLKVFAYCATPLHP